MDEAARRAHMERVVRETDLQVRSAHVGDNLRRFDAVRVAACVLAPVDVFCVVLVDERARTTAFPYYWIPDGLRDGGEYPYGPRGLTAWLVASGRSYRWSQDQGRLAAMGWPTDDPATVLDMVACPMRREDATVGFLVAQSTRADSFDESFVSALEHMALSLVAALVADDALAAAPLGFDLYPRLRTEITEDRAALVNYLSEGLLEIRQALDDLGDLEAARDAARLCDALRADVLTRLFVPRPTAHTARADLLASLSPRERAVVDALLAEDDPSTAALAAALHMSPDTVKSHLRHIMRKLGITSRREIRWLLGTQSDEHRP